MTKLAFLGSKTIGLQILSTVERFHSADNMIVLHPDDSHDARSVYPEFREAAKRQGIEFCTVKNVREMDSTLGAFKPDIALVCAWYVRIKASTLALSKRGFVGLHHSLLPKYRGGAPLVWALINGEAVVGSSLFHFTENLDDGPIYRQWRENVSQDDTIGEVAGRLENQILEDFPKVWAGILSDELQPTPQESQDASYCGQRKPADGEINWHSSAVDVHNFIRAQAPPYPGAYTYKDNRKITVRRSRLVDGEHYGTPGQCIRWTADGVVIACGERSAIELIDIDVDGQPANPAAVINSTKLRLPSWPKW